MSDSNGSLGGSISLRASADHELNSSNKHHGKSRKRSYYDDRDDCYKHPGEKRSRNYHPSPERSDENRERNYSKDRERSYRDDSYRDHRARTYYDYELKDDRRGRYNSFSQHEKKSGMM